MPRKSPANSDEHIVDLAREIVEGCQIVIGDAVH